MKHVILITGASGFVGTNVSEYFSNREEYYLVGIDISVQSKNYYNEFYSWNDLEKIDWNNVETIIHLAGKAHDTSKNADPKEYFRVNVGLTKIILDYFYKSNTKKIIYFSSTKAAADRVYENVLTEEITPNPKTPYGLSKLQAEEYILSQQIDPSKQSIVLRPCMIHGPKNKGNLNSLYKFVKMGFPYPLAAFQNQRSFTTMKNLVYLLEAIICKENIQSGIYNVADDETISSNTLIELIAENLSKKKKLWNVKKEIIEAISIIGDWLKLPLNSEVLKKITESYVVSNKKIKTSLGIDKLPVSAIEGMRMTLKSFNNKEN